MGFPGPAEWIIPAFIILLLFGAKRLPELARAIGKALREFKKGAKEITDEVRSQENKDDKGEEG